MKIEEAKTLGRVHTHTHTHTGDLRNKIKGQKGSVTLFVLVTCLFMITILLLVNVGIMNKLTNQKKQIAQITENYAVNETDLENTYKKIADKDGYPSYEDVKDIVEEMIKGIKEEVKLEAFPVGSVYISTNSTNPCNYLGGTWESYGQGRTLVGEGTGTDANSTVQSFKAGGTGGEYTHRLTIAEMPSHNHNISFANQPAGAYYSFPPMAAGPNTSWYNGATNNEGGGENHNNIQPYIVTYMWKRTS